MIEIISLESSILGNWSRYCSCIAILIGRRHGSRLIAHFQQWLYAFFAFSPISPLAHQGIGSFSFGTPLIFGHYQFSTGEVQKRYECYFFVQLQPFQPLLCSLLSLSFSTCLSESWCASHTSQPGYFHSISSLILYWLLLHQHSSCSLALSSTFSIFHGSLCCPWYVPSQPACWSLIQSFLRVCQGHAQVLFLAVCNLSWRPRALPWSS